MRHRPFSPMGRHPPSRIGRVDAGSPSADKGRCTVCCSPAAETFTLCGGKPNAPAKVGGPGGAGRVANAKRPDREYLPFTDEVVERHLAGTVHAGLYPLLAVTPAGPVVCDFDGPGWALDTARLPGRRSCCGYPCSVGTVAIRRRWPRLRVLFADVLPRPRRIGVFLLREAMTVRAASLDLSSYDRLFPAQDFMPKGSFGNLIALPLQGGCSSAARHCSWTPRPWSRSRTSGRSCPRSSLWHRDPQ